MTPLPVTFELNGREVLVWVQPNDTLLSMLREQAGAIEVKYGCGEGVCGTCTVLLDGQPVNACLLLAAQVEGSSILTLAGLRGSDGELHPLQQQFLERGGAQCGFCTPGMILTALHYVQEGGSPDRGEIRSALSGNLCRCTGYVRIVDAVAAYAAQPEPAAQP